jgi:hypothetical protein
MSIKCGMTVRTVKACAILSAQGTEDLPEGAKGTVLAMEGDAALVTFREGQKGYVQVSRLAGCKGRPLKAESLAAAMAAHHAAGAAARAS